MVIRRGDIWWANLPEPVGSSPGFARPVLVIQADKFNSSELNTVVIAVIRKSLWLAEADGNVLLKKAQTGLPNDSVVNVSQLFTVDEAILRDFVSRLADRKMRQVDSGLKKVLGLNEYPGES